MSTTPLFDITEWEQDQEQPHITVNTAIRICEIMSQLVIADQTTTPPGSPADGDAYYIDGAGTGDWDTHDDVLALRIGSSWHYVTPRDGWRAWDAQSSTLVRFESGSAPGWIAV